MTDAIQIRFSENPRDELANVVEELELLKIVQALESNPGGVTDDARKQLYKFVQAFGDLFSVKLPVGVDIYTDLRRAARDLQLSRLLRERGLARLFIAASYKNAQGVPLYMQLKDTSTGAFFAKQEDFIDWFCREAGVSRAMVFMRKKTYERLIRLGMSMSEAFEMVMTKPYTILKVLDDMGTWGKGGALLSISDHTAQSLGNLLPEGDDRDAITAAIEDQDEAALLEAVRPALRNLLEEVASHATAKDARDFVEHDVLSRPEIKAWWDQELDCLVIQANIMDTDAKGNQFLASTETIRFLPDTPALNPVIRFWLIDRLPIRNRDSLAF